MKRLENKSVVVSLVLFLAVTMACGSSGPEATPSEPTQASIEQPSENQPTEAATQVPATEEVQNAPAGSSPENPLSSAEKLVTQDWEIQVLEDLRGDEALTMLESVSSFNGPHEDPGMEHVLLKVYVKYIGSAESAYVYGKMFRSLDSAGEIYDAVSFIDVEVPAPELDADLPSGGETEGWVAVQAGVDETGLMLVFWPYDSYDNGTAMFSDSAEKWYIALE